MSMKKKMAAAYDVGYGKPPRTSQFKKGQSGNPKGRPKGAKSFDSRVAAAFERKIDIQEKGRVRRISLADGILMKLAAKAIAGDMSATRLAVGLLQFTRQETTPADVFSNQADRALLLEYLEGHVSSRPRKSRAKRGAK